MRPKITKILKVKIGQPVTSFLADFKNLVTQHVEQSKNQKFAELSRNTDTMLIETLKGMVHDLTVKCEILSMSLQTGENSFTSLEESTKVTLGTSFDSDLSSSTAEKISKRHVKEVVGVIAAKIVNKIRISFKPKTLTKVQNSI